MTVFTLLEYNTTAEGAYSGTFFDAAKEAAERFGPLRAILRVISANYADDEVRS